MFQFMNVGINLEQIDTFSLHTNLKYQSSDKEVTFETIKLTIIYRNNKFLQCFEIDSSNKSHIEYLKLFIKEIFDISYSKAEETLQDMLDKNNQLIVNK